MRRTVTLAAVMGALALALWLGDAAPLFALPSCNQLQGQACVPGGFPKWCIDESSGEPAPCSCVQGHQSCPVYE